MGRGTLNLEERAAELVARRYTQEDVDDIVRDTIAAEHPGAIPPTATDVRRQLISCVIDLRDEPFPRRLADIDSDADAITYAAVETMDQQRFKSELLKRLEKYIPHAVKAAAKGWHDD